MDQWVPPSVWSEGCLLYPQKYLLAKGQYMAICVFLTVNGFEADKNSNDSKLQQDLQASHFDWAKQTGKNWASLTTTTKLIKDVLVLPFPDLLQRTPNNLPFPSPD